jgi:hypothetical protein
MGADEVSTRLASSITRPKSSTFVFLRLSKKPTCMALAGHGPSAPPASSPGPGDEGI